MASLKRSANGTPAITGWAARSVSESCRLQAIVLVAIVASIERHTREVVYVSRAYPENNVCTAVHEHVEAWTQRVRP